MTCERQVLFCFQDYKLPQNSSESIRDPSNIFLHSEALCKGTWNKKTSILYQFAPETQTLCRLWLLKWQPCLLDRSPAEHYSLKFDLSRERRQYSPNVRRWSWSSPPESVLQEHLININKYKETEFVINNKFIMHNLMFMLNCMKQVQEQYM